MSFYQKINIARSISLDESQNEMWELLGLINEYRNQLAHSLDEEIHNKKIDKLLNKYFDIYSDDPEIQKERNQPTELSLTSTIVVILGFLGSFESEIDRYKSAVEKLDKIMNPHRRH